MKRSETARIFAAVMAVIMMFALLPTSAFADNDIKEIAAARTLDGSITVKGVVTCAYGGGLFIQDATDAIFVKTNDLPTGITRGTVVIASGICGSAFGESAIVNATVSVSSGVTLQAENTTVSALSGYNSGRYVKLDGLEVESRKGAEVVLKDSGDNKVTLNNSALYILEPGEKLNLYAAVLNDGGSTILMNSSASEVVKINTNTGSKAGEITSNENKGGTTGAVGSRIANALTSIEGNETVVIYNVAAAATVGSAAHEEAGKYSLTPIEAIIGTDTVAYSEGTAVFTVINKDNGKFSFKSGSSYLSLTGDDVKLVSAEGEDTVFTLEQATGGLKIKSAKYEDLYLEYRNSYISPSDSSNTGSRVFKFFKVNTPEPTAPAAPTADVEPGEVGKNTELNFTAETGAKIYYKTADGYTEYTGTLKINQDTTYIVYAEKGGLRSEEAVFAYTVRKGAAVAGGSYVIFNEANSDLGYSVGIAADIYCMSAVKTTVKGGYAVPENGALVFEVGNSGGYTYFMNDGKYLTTDNSENLFLSAELSDYALWTLTESNGSYVITNKEARFETAEVCLEYHDGFFFTSNYEDELASVLEFDFFPVNEDVTVVDGIVRDPCVKISGNSSRFITEDYTATFSVDDIAGNLSSVAVGFVNADGEPESVTYADKGNRSYSFTIGADKLDELGDSFTIEVVIVNDEGQRYVTKKTVENVDKPYVVSMNPSDKSYGNDSRSTIEIKVKNMGVDPLISLVVNGEEFLMPKVGYSTEEDGAVGVITFEPESEYPVGRVAVMFCVQRQDGVQVNKAFSFTVGDQAFLHYYGQLNGHTQVSDGEGSIEDVIKYMDTLSKEDNVDFISVVDSSVEFDKGTDANPAEAIGNAGAATPESRSAWTEYNNVAEKYNNDQNMRVALTGYEIEWPDGVGHITTYNSKGVVSTRNSDFSTTAAGVGLDEYYSAVASEYGAGTVSQYNSPAETGNFDAFADVSEVRDNRMALVEITSTDGRISEENLENYVLALDRGWHVSPIGTQTVMSEGWAEENQTRDVIVTADFSKDGLLAAMLANSVYTTEDKNLEVNFSAKLGNTVYAMGNAADASTETPVLTVSAIDADDEKIEKIELIGDNGKVVKTWEDPAVQVSFSAQDTDCSYYFVRVTENDGDVAVTSPIWVGETFKAGISAVKCETAYPATGEELVLDVEFFNEETAEAQITNIDFRVDGETIGTVTEDRIVTKGRTTRVTFKYVPTEARNTTIEVVADMKLGGMERERTKSITVDIADSDKLLYVGVDESHNNAMTAETSENLGKLAKENNIRIVYLNTQEELLEALENPKYTAMIFTAPVNLDNAESNLDNFYKDNEIAAIKKFNTNGGALIITGISDANDIAGKTQSSEIQNKLLLAVESKLQLSDNTLTDNTHNGGEKDELYLSSYNFDSFLTKGVVVDSNHVSDYADDGANTQFYAQNGGSSVYCVDGAGKPVAEPEKSVTPVVYALSTAAAGDMDADGMIDSKYPRNNTTAFVAMAAEKQAGRGLILVAGGSFMDDDSLRSADPGKKELSNVTICENLFKELNPVAVTDISAVNRQTAGGYKYTIEGVVTSNSYTYNSETGFIDCLYVQDSTGGIRCVNVSGSYKVGDKLRVSGTNSRVNGESTFKVNSIELLSSKNDVQPKSIKASEGFSNTGRLVSFEGYVTDIITNGDNLVTDIIAKDSTNKTIRISIDENITPDKTVANLKKGVSITVTGIESYDNTYNTAAGGPFERIRVRDRDDVKCSDHVHEYIWEDTVKATCTVDGYRTGTCNCGDVKTEVVKATGHDWSEWVTTRRATAYTSGSKQRICGNCGAIEFQKIPATKSPSTGDGEMLLVWILIADVALAAGTSFAVYAKKRRNGMIG